MFTSEVLFQRSACTCCMPRTCPPPKRSTDLNVAPDVDKASSSTAFYFRCRSPKRIAIRSPFPSTWTSESSMKRRLPKAHILNRKLVVQLKTQNTEIRNFITFRFVYKNVIGKFVDKKIILNPKYLSGKINIT